MLPEDFHNIPGIVDAAVVRAVKGKSGVAKCAGHAHQPGGAGLLSALKKVSASWLVRDIFVGDLHR